MAADATADFAGTNIHPNLLVADHMAVGVQHLAVDQAVGGHLEIEGTVRTQRHDSQVAGLGAGMVFPGCPVARLGLVAGDRGQRLDQPHIAAPLLDQRIAGEEGAGADQPAGILVRARRLGQGDRRSARQQRPRLEIGGAGIVVEQVELAGLHVAEIEPEVEGGFILLHRFFRTGGAEDGGGVERERRGHHHRLVMRDEGFGIAVLADDGQSLLGDGEDLAAKRLELRDPQGPVAQAGLDPADAHAFGGVEPELAPFRAIEDHRPRSVGAGRFDIPFGFQPRIEEFQAAEADAAIVEQHRFGIAAEIEADDLDVGAIRVHRRQAGGEIAMVFVAGAEPAGGEDDAAVGKIVRLDIVVGAGGELAEVAAVGVHLVKVPPGIGVAATAAEDDPLGIPGDFAVGDITLLELGQRRHLRLAVHQVEAEEIVAGPVGRSGIGGRVKLPPVVHLISVRRLQAAFDEDEGTAGRRGGRQLDLELRPGDGRGGRQRRDAPAPQGFPRHDPDGVVGMGGLGLLQRGQGLGGADAVEFQRGGMADLQDVFVALENLDQQRHRLGRPEPPQAVDEPFAPARAGIAVLILAGRLGLLEIEDAAIAIIGFRLRGGQQVEHRLDGGAMVHEQQGLGGVDPDPAIVGSEQGDQVGGIGRIAAERRQPAGRGVGFVIVADPLAHGGGQRFDLVETGQFGPGPFGAELAEGDVADGLAGLAAVEQVAPDQLPGFGLVHHPAIVVAGNIGEQHRNDRLQLFTGLRGGGGQARERQGKRIGSGIDAVKWRQPRLVMGRNLRRMLFGQ